jgi:DNA-binding response OmpR family regulator
MAFIYIADDDELLCDIIKAALRDWGHTVGSVENGDDVLAAIPIKKPDLVILDCNMPGSSGLLVLRALRNSQQFCELPVIMLTARASAADEAIARLEGANDYIKKPADPDFVAFRVDELLSLRARYECR